MVSTEEGVEKGFLTVFESEWPTSTVVSPDKTINPWEKQVLQKKRVVASQKLIHCRLKMTAMTTGLN